MSNPTTPNQSFSRRLRAFQRQVNKTTKALAANATTNPFGNSAGFLEVGYLDQINHVSPPTVNIVNFLPPETDVATNGLTIEFWFKAESSGILVGQPLATTSGSSGFAPLLYIDSNGFLRGGLFDATKITLLSPPQNLIASQDSNGVITVGPLNALASPLSVVDGQWHHAALVVLPGDNAIQSLFLDGRLAATGNGNGSFSLSFVDNNGSTWNPQANTAQLGGSITPQPQSLPSPNFLPYAAGFVGCLNELRSWNGSRTVTQIQQLMAQPLGPDLTTYQQQGLFGYLGSSQLQTAVQPSTYLSLVSDAPPFDPFNDVSNRIPGYQNFGVFTAIPFTTVALQVTFQPFQPYSTKITLSQADNLQVSFPGQDANGDNLSGAFSMVLTGAASGEIQTIYQIAPGAVFTITAPVTDCYRLDFTYATAAPCTIDNLQFMLIPGPGNTLMQLLLDIVPLQTAYTDPSYPITETTQDDPRNPGQTVTLYSYWPLFTDQTIFPIDTNNFDADDLLSAYLNFNEQARTLALSGGSTFSDFFNLSANQATVSDVGDLSTLLQYAYTKVTGNPPPTEVPAAPFDSANDQIYSFIYNANSMRNTLSEFLTKYQSWAQIIIDELALSNIPGGIANQIYNDQKQLDAALKGPSTGDFIANLLVGSALWGLGAVLGSILLGPEAAVGVTIAVGFLGSAGANAASEIFGIFFNSTSLRAKLTPVSYSTLEEVAAGVAADTSQAYTTILDHLLDPSYLQTLYSNYGLLQALNFISAQPLFDVNQNAIQPGKEDPLTIGATYASWQALVPSVFKWTPKPLTYHDDISDSHVAFSMSKPSHFLTLPSGSMPTQLPVYEILQANPDVFYEMVAKIQEWQTATKSPSGEFFSICPIFFHSISQSDPNPPVFTAAWVITWSLLDTNGHNMSDDLVASLFGMGNPNVILSPMDQNNPCSPAGYGWYCQIANGAVTTPFDAFMNWGEGVPSYSPQILVAQLPQDGELYPTNFQGDPFLYAAAAANDTPPAAIVTLDPGTLDFGAVTTGSAGELSGVLANNQKGTLKNISVKSNYPSVFDVSGAPAELQSGQTAEINVTFSPTVVGEQSGEITFSASGDYGPILLTLGFSGTGVAPQPAIQPGTIFLQGDPSVWNQVQFYIFDDYSDALANWNTGTNSVGLAELDQQGSRCSGLPSAWLAGSGMGSESTFFMIVYFCNDIVLQFGADGAQAGVTVQGYDPPPATGDAGSLTWNGSPAWAEGITYYLFATCAEALQNWNTGTNALTGGTLTDGQTATGLPSGWLAVAGNNQGTIQPYLIVQYYNDLAAMLSPYNAQAVIYFK